MFCLCNFLLFSSIEEKNSPVFWNEVVCVWKEERIQAHLQKASRKKKGSIWGTYSDSPYCWCQVSVDTDDLRQ